MRAAFFAAIVLAALLAAAPSHSQDFVAVPELRGPVNDAAGVLSAPQARAIEGLARELEQKTGAEMVVLTLPSTAPETVFDYGMRVADAWNLGKRGKDDGLLFVIAVEDRKLHIFTGYGLEGVLPDGRVGEIRDRYMLSFFREGSYANGIYAGMRAAAEIIAADAGVELSGQPLRRPQRRRSDDRGSLLPLLVFFLFPLLPILLGGGRFRRRRFYGPVFYGGGLGGGRQHPDDGSD